MRIFSVFAGILYVGTGVLCFLFSDYSFASLAFPVGSLMLLCGICITSAFLASGKRHRLPDTVLVEGIIDCMFGFAVLNNQVDDAMLSIFFGSFTSIAGATRISQSFDVSRYKPRDWAKVMPLAFFTTVLGMMMMMPRLFLDVDAIILIGSAFILNGFSLLIYCMYMERRTASQKEAEALERSRAKKEAAEKKKEEKERLNRLSGKERAYAKEQLRQQKKKEKEELRQAKRLEEDLIKESLQNPPKDGDTKQIKPEDVAQIQEMSAEEELFERTIHSTVRKTNFDNDYSGTYSQSFSNASPKTKSLASLRNMSSASEEKTASSLRHRTAIKLDELENQEAHIEFEAPQLRDVELVSKNVKNIDRESILASLDKPVNTLKPDFAPMEAIRVEDLITEELPHFNSVKQNSEAFNFTFGMNPLSKDDIESYNNTKAGKK